MSSVHAERIRAAVAAFTRANESLLSQLEALTDAERVPEDGGWTPAQIAWHVAETNTFAAGLLLGKVPGARVSLGFVEDPHVFAKIPPRVVIPIPERYPPADITRDEAATMLRASAVEAVRAMESLIADRAGTYTVQFPFGVISLYQVAEFVGAHVTRHQAQLTRATEKTAAKQTSGRVPIIDVSPLVTRSGDCARVAGEIDRACREVGFFYVSNHGVDEGLQRQLEDLSRRFFAQDVAAKMEISMDRGGRAWRGYFPVGAELTSGKPDVKEGIYFGTELSADHPLVRAGTPLHGPNLFPASMPEMRETVLAYMAQMTRLGHALMEGIALALDLDPSYFADRYTADPLTLFRIFNYPADPAATTDEPRWGVGEHTDYGLLTILKQDDTGGLQVKSKDGWIAAPPIAGAFLCNLGDMLDRMTAGLYRSTPHRVQNVTRRNRLSFPFFFDPNFNAVIRPIIPPDQRRVDRDRDERWDHASVHEFEGTYGDYVLNKVAKVFPQLRQSVL